MPVIFPGDFSPVIFPGDFPPVIFPGDFPPVIFPGDFLSVIFPGHFPQSFTPVIFPSTPVIFQPRSSSTPVILKPGLFQPRSFSFSNHRQSFTRFGGGVGYTLRGSTQYTMNRVNSPVI